MKAVGLGNQFIAAFKKYWGIAAIMDLGKEEYGLMLDSEISLYDLHAQAGNGKACEPGGAWTKLYSRIRAFESQKVWPAARVSSTLAVYNFGSFKKSGKDYDQHLMRENSRFLNLNEMDKESCTMDSCGKVWKALDKVLWSWWTDIPWLNLDVARRMFAQHEKIEVEGVTSWRKVAQGISFPRFEYVAYQMWTMLYDGWDIRDVTSITLEAKWGSYLEDPQDGSKLSQLNPMWVSANALSRAEEGRIAKLSTQDPPLLIFHVDHEDLMYSYGGQQYKALWETLLLHLLKLHKRIDYGEQNIH